MSNTEQATRVPDVTADIQSTPHGHYLRVTVDGDPITFEINPHSLKLRRISVTDEAERLLQRHAGYRPASSWTPDRSGRLTAAVAEMPGRCRTCVHGCGCEIGSTGCGHYLCPAASAGHANTCDGAALAVAAKRTYPTARQAERGRRR